MRADEKARELQRILDNCAKSLHELKKYRTDDKRSKRLAQLTIIILRQVHLAYMLGAAHQMQDFIDEELRVNGNDETGGGNGPEV